MCDDHIAQQLKMLEERAGRNSQGLLRNDDSNHFQGGDLVMVLLI